MSSNCIMNSAQTNKFKKNRTNAVLNSYTVRRKLISQNESAIGWFNRLRINDTN